MQRIVVAIAVMAFIGFGVMFGVGASGAKIFPCERQVAADGSFTYGFGSKKAVGWKDTTCRLGAFRVKYKGSAYAMMFGLFLIGPLLIGLLLGGGASKKDPKTNAVTLNLAVLGLAGAIYPLIQVGMKGRGADMEIMMAILGGAFFFSMLAALISRGGQKLALGGPIVGIGMMVLSMM